MKSKRSTVGELQVGDTVGWYHGRAKVIRLEREGGFIRVYTDWTPVGTSSITNQIFMLSHVFTKLVDDRPPGHSPCRDSDCDCIYDNVAE